MNPNGTFLTRPGLVPLMDGKNWELADMLRFQLPDGRIIEVPKGFKTDLASVPPLGVVGGSVMALGYLISQFTQWGSLAVAAGFAVCIISAYLKAFGKYTLAAVLHDWLFKTHLFPFTVCNWYLLIAMRSEKTAPWERAAIWFNVQVFGYGIYKSDKRQRSFLNPNTLNDTIKPREL